MKLKSSLSFLLAGVAMSTALWFTACKKEEKAAPVITLSASTYSGKIGTTATTTATITAEAGLRALRITKYKGVTVDATFGTNGTETYNHTDHTLNYVLTDEGLAAPVRFKFEAEDNEGKVTTADFIITTEVSVRYLLTTYNWLWKSKLGKCLDSDPESEQIVDCEKDNYFVFNADGTFKLEYGPITGGAGSCQFDGFRVGDTWTLNADETELTMKSPSIFDPNDVLVEVYKISEFSNTAIKSKQTIDLSVFGCIIYDWKFEWTAKPK